MIFTDKRLQEIIQTVITDSEGMKTTSKFRAGDEKEQAVLLWGRSKRK